MYPFSSVKSVLLQKLDLHQDPSAAYKIKKQSQSLIALAFAFSLAEFRKGRTYAKFLLRQILQVRSGKPRHPNRPKLGAAVNKQVMKMAIYHCEMQNISRSDGRSIVACAAYRAGEKLYCDTYGKEQDYTKKTGIEYTQIFAPVGASPDLLDRQTLWNQVEQSELKKDGSIKQEARLAKEVEVALPHELDKAQRQALVTELCQSLVKSYGVAVDAAIHAPHVHGGSDHRNFHAHILMTTRTATPQGLGKKVRELDRHSTLKKIREEVADLTNRHLAAAGLDLAVDHRSHKDRGLDIEPTFKEGLEATHAKRRGGGTGDRQA